jgi:hypothetical protein
MTPDVVDIKITGALTGRVDTPLSEKPAASCREIYFFPLFEKI